MLRVRSFLILIAGLLAGAILISPVGAHVTKSFTHLWKAHIKPKVTDLAYTKAQSEGRFLAKNGKANDSDELDGLDSTAFARSTLEDWNVVGGPGEPPFGVSVESPCTWSHYDTGPESEWPPVAFYKDPFGIVHLRGLALMSQPGGGNCADEGGDKIIFVLPSGYRPSGTVLVDTLANGASSRLDVKSDGRVVASASYEGEPVWVSLDEVTFRADGN